MLRALVKGLAIEQPGQRIDAGKLLQRVLRAVLLGNVAPDADITDEITIGPVKRRAAKMLNRCAPSFDGTTYDEVGKRLAGI